MIDATVATPSSACANWSTVWIVSPAFAGLNAVKRHQKVYATVGELMGQIHALALHTYTPEEWAAQGTAPASPTCRGGH